MQKKKSHMNHEMGLAPHADSEADFCDRDAAHYITLSARGEIEKMARRRMGAVSHSVEKFA